VEDNQQVRTLAETILEKQGYKVLAAADGVEAEEKLKNYKDTVHLLLADVVLPNMNGKEVYNRAIKKCPNLKVLYMFGYTDNVIAHRGVLDENINYIQRPFSVHSLGSKVRDVLGKGDSE
jgi:DNA-binding NtrC family response regulator